MSRRKDGGNLFLGDDENEFHVDLTQGGECYYAGSVSSGEDLSKYYDEFLKAEKNRKKFC